MIVTTIISSIRVKPSCRMSHAGQHSMGALC